ncbi:acriflavin resistance protein [Plesiocystis pacifica SIR-1]|uniref:Acriflavin resistance protein n=1 Tax=Plesiocystis pacifica SIR-1 TaxID=391625 RepID=A6G6M4_9BACT|nr:efflux RND transporter permease subunit [Plesiocystis pacifica]EDM78501.1 acriflavin resistance protein [Plesiocystis pacifica SIR-1]
MRRWSLSDLALARPVTVGMLLVAVFLLGTIALAKLPLAFLPAESAQRISIRVNLTRTSPEILERDVIRPLEESIAGVRDLEQMRVSSGSWGVRMRLKFRPGTDIDARKLEVRERVDRTRPDLPDTIQNIDLSSSSGAADEPVMQLRIASNEPLDGAYELIDRRVVRAIERIEGVARVELDGVEPRELEVAVDLDAARGYGVDLDQVGGVVRQSQRGRSLGTLRRSSRDAGVRSPGAPPKAEYFADLPVARGAVGRSQAAATADTTEAAAVDTELLDAGDAVAVVSNASTGDELNADFARLGELARVSIHPKEKRRGSRLNGRPAINLDVFADAGASPVEVSARVRETVDELRRDPALGGVDVAVFNDQGEVILDTLGDLRDTGIYGGLIGVVVLFGFLHRWRTTLTAAVCIPLSVLAACGVLFLRGSELNCIVLLALVLCVGMLIDNAVVIVESIQQRLQRGDPPFTAALEGAREVGLATVASTMSSVIVFLPMIVGQSPGDMYTYMKPLGSTFVTALVASLLVSQLAVPLLMILRRPSWLGGPKDDEDGEGTETETETDSATSTPRGFRPTRNVLLEPVAAFYGRLVGWTIRHPRMTLAVGLCLCASAYYPAQNMNIDMGMDERMIAMPIRLEFTGSRDYRDVITGLEAVEDELLPRKDELGIETLTCRYRDWGGTCDAYPANDIESEAQMSDFKQGLQASLPEQPGVRYAVGERDGWWMGGRDPREVGFVIRGEDMGTLFELSERLAEHMAERLPKGDFDNPEAGGYDRINGPFNEGNEELHVVLDPDRLQRLGLRAGEVSQMVALAFQGVPLGSIRGPEGEVELRLSTGSLDPQSSAQGARGPGIADLGDLRIPLPAPTDTGVTEVPLSSIADIELERSPWWVQRVDRQTEVRLRVRFFGTDRGANQAAVEAAREGFALPAGYSIGQGTRWGMENDEMLQLAINLGLCLILVYAVMASLFESFLQPGAILATGLLGCFGAPWAMWASGTTFDIVAMIGLFILVGIIVNNGIMLVDKVTQLRGDGLGRDEALAQAGKDRLRPVLMTAATTIFGLVPMLLHHPTLAGIYYHSIAIIIAAGLATSTVMTLVFLPSAYVLVENFSLESQRIWAGITSWKRSPPQ